MSAFNISVPSIISQVVDEILTLPFYQDGDVFFSSTHLLHDEFSPTMTQRYLSEVQEDGEDRDAWYTTITNAIQTLSEIPVFKDDLDQLLLYQTRVGSMITFKDAVDKFRADITLLAYTQFVGGAEIEKNEEEATLRIGYTRVLLKTPEEIEDKEVAAEKSDDVVLNRNNPFADVSIRDQQFIYAADHGRFNALELNTSHTLTRVQKNEELSVVTLQPGFKIRNSTKLDSGTGADIAFDDTLTSEITQNDDRTYIYVDISDLTS